MQVFYIQSCYYAGVLIPASPRFVLQNLYLLSIYSLAHSHAQQGQTKLSLPIFCMYISYIYIYISHIHKMVMYG